MSGITERRGELMSPSSREALRRIYEKFNPKPIGVKSETHPLFNAETNKNVVRVPRD